MEERGGARKGGKLSGGLWEMEGEEGEGRQTGKVLRRVWEIEFARKG